MNINGISNQWEYRAESFKGFSMKKTIEEMNKLGNDGWELISVVRNPAGDIFYFKRKITFIPL